MRTEDRDRVWPPIPFEPWRDTCAALHRLTQLVGKIRLACTPWINHSWHVTLYVTARGFTTGPMAHGVRVFQIDLDLIDHRLVVAEAAGARREIPLRPTSIAAFHRELEGQLDEMGLSVEIVPTPNEIADARPLDRDDVERPYDADAVNRFWRATASADRVLRRFRSRFIGKCSPIHFFWGSFDLAVTRFSGRRAPTHPGGVPRLPDAVTREAYSHEVSSAGFWPGTPGGPVAEAAFYSYSYPAPEGFAQARVRPAAAYFHQELGEFVLPYDVVRTAASPDDVLLDFLQSTYEAAAELGRWDREALERKEGPPAGVAHLSAPAPASRPTGRS